MYSKAHHTYYSWILNIWTNFKNFLWANSDHFQIEFPFLCPAFCLLVQFFLHELRAMLKRNGEKVPDIGDFTLKHMIPGVVLKLILCSFNLSAYICISTHVGCTVVWYMSHFSCPVSSGENSGPRASWQALSSVSSCLLRCLFQR